MPHEKLAYVRVFSRAEHDAIEQIYGKKVADLHAPAGYEFTGEFRVPKRGEIVPNEYGCNFPFFYNVFDGSKSELILRKIEEKDAALEEISEILAKRAVENVCEAMAQFIEKEPEQLELPLSEPKKGNILGGVFPNGKDGFVFGYTADDILARYGQNVLDVFGYREGSLKDHPGFVYSGELTNVNPGEWYVYAGQVKKWEPNLPSQGSSLTLLPTAPPEPRIVTFTLTAREDIEDGEATYIQDDQGGFMSAADAPAGAAVYTRSEVA